MKPYLAGVLAAAILLLAVPGQAHHSFAGVYFMDKTIEVTGSVVELKLANPHLLLKVEVTSADGKKAIWFVDGPNSGTIKQRGWTTTTLIPGEKVVLKGYPARNPVAKGMFGISLTKQDGTVLRIGEATDQ